MILDLEPLSIQKSQLSDALNATVLTYNGNDGVLQNDMGNTLIQDSNTGNLMGLQEGFIPVGMKEHGGVLYLASINREGEGQIGTIPSPVVRNTVKDHVNITINQQLADDNGPVATPCTISEKLYPGERYVMQLEFDQDSVQQTSLIDAKDIEIATIPLITQQSINSKYSQSGGIYTLIQYTQNNNGVVETKELLPQQYYTKSSNVQQNASNWWINGTQLIGFDINKMSTNQLFQVYPGTVQPGKLQVKLKLNNIKSFDLIPRKGGLQVPYTLRLISGEEGKEKTKEFWVCIPGFQYTTESGIRIGKIVLSIKNKDTNQSYQLVGFQLADQVGQSGKELTFLVKDYFDKKDPNFYNAETYYYGDGELVNAKCTLNQEESTFLLTPISETLDNIASNALECVWAESADKKEDEDKISGLCHFVIDQIDQWFVLNATYYDQYGGKLGNYQVTFNPAVNDAFGALNTPDVEAATPVEIVHNENEYTPKPITYTSADYKNLDQNCKIQIGYYYDDTSWVLYRQSYDDSHSHVIKGSTYNSTTIPLALNEQWHCTYFGAEISKYKVSETNTLDNLKIGWEKSRVLRRQETAIVLSKDQKYHNNANGCWTSFRMNVSKEWETWSSTHTLNPIRAINISATLLGQSILSGNDEDKIDLFVYDSTNSHTITSPTPLLIDKSITLKSEALFNEVKPYTTNSRDTKNGTKFSFGNFSQWDLNQSNLDAQYIDVNNDTGELNLLLTGQFKNKVTISSETIDTSVSKKQIIPYYKHIVDNRQPVGKLTTLSNFQAITIDTKNDWKIETTETTCDGRGFEQNYIVGGEVSVRQVEVNANPIIINTIGKEWKSIIITEDDKELLNIANTGRYFEPIVISSEGAFSITLTGDMLYNFGIYKAKNAGTKDVSGVFLLSEYNDKIKAYNEKNSDSQVDPIILPLVSVYKEKIYNGANIRMFNRELTGELYIPKDAYYMIHTINDDNPTKQDLWYYQPSTLLKDYNKYQQSISGITNSGSIGLDWKATTDPKDVTDYMTSYLRVYPYENYGQSQYTTLNGELSKLTFNSICKYK